MYNKNYYNFYFFGIKFFEPDGTLLFWHNLTSAEDTACKLLIFLYFFTSRVLVMLICYILVMLICYKKKPFVYYQKYLSYMFLCWRSTHLRMPVVRYMTL